MSCQQCEPSMQEIVEQAFHDLEETARPSAAMTGTPTGFRELDELTGGLQPGELTVATSESPGVLTAFALNVIDYLAIERSHPVVLLSLGLSRQQIGERMLALRAGIPMQRLRKGIVTGAEAAAIERAAGELTQAPITVEPMAERGLGEVEHDVRQLVADYGRRVLLVELSPSSPTINPHRLRTIASDLQVPALAMRHVDRPEGPGAGVASDVLLKLERAEEGAWQVITRKLGGRRTPGNLCMIQTRRDEATVTPAGDAR